MSGLSEREKKRKRMAASRARQHGRDALLQWAATDVRATLPKGLSRADAKAAAKHIAKHVQLKPPSNTVTTVLQNAGVRRNGELTDDQRAQLLAWLHEQIGSARTWAEDFARQRAEDDARMAAELAGKQGRG